MKQFDLKAALLGAPVQTRDGRKVKKIEPYTVYSQTWLYVTLDDDSWSCYEDGIYSKDFFGLNKHDLVMADMNDYFEKALEQLHAIRNHLYGGYYEPKSDRDIELGDAIGELFEKFTPSSSKMPTHTEILPKTHKR